MSPQYEPVPALSTDAPRQVLDGNVNAEYELGSIRGYSQDRYEPFASQPHADPSFTEDHSYTNWNGDRASAADRVLGDVHTTSKMSNAAFTSVTSLTSHPDSGNPPRGPTGRTPLLRGTALSWMWEIFAVTVSVGALLAIIAVLYREDGKPLTAWTLAFTLNTVVAALGTLARTSLAFALSACVGQQKWNWLRLRPDRLVAWERFDEASRGPWGATRLFIWLRARHWAALGALVIVGTVAFDPFLQAILTTDGLLDDASVVTTAASIPQALTIDSGMVVEMPTLATSQARTSAGVLGFTGATSAQPDFGMISAIYDGFRNDTSWYLGERAVNSVCETGNCTWPDFTSAAICSACNDLSDSVKVNRGYGVGGGSIPAPSNVKLSTNYTAFTLQYVNLSNPDTKLYEAAKGGVKNGMEATLLTANRTFDASKTVSFHDLKTMLISIIVLRASEDWMLGKVMWNNSKPIATECALYLCANKYSANTQNGKLNETLLKSWAERDEESYQASTNSSIFEPGPEADAWVASKGSMLYDPLVPRSDLRMSIPVDEDIDTNPRTFNVSYAFITTMSEFLKEITNGTWNINQMAYPPWSSGMTPLVNALWESQNLTETFDHVARSLTYQVRTSSNNASNIIELQGKTQKYSIHVCVRWVYLAFPIAMIALGVIYVVLTIIESTRLHVPVWKESALPGLLHGLDNDTQSLLRGTQSQVIRNRPGDMTVRFGYDEKDETYRLLPEEKNRQHM